VCVRVGACACAWVRRGSFAYYEEEGGALIAHCPNVKLARVAPLSPSVFEVEASGRLYHPLRFFYYSFLDGGITATVFVQESLELWRSEPRGVSESCGRMLIVWCAT
jgi:hypothetical protein